MFIYQGQKAFYLWNKINPEIDQKLIELIIIKIKMKKIGITGSIASGKTTASKILSKKKALFSADVLLKNYIKKISKNLVSKKFNI